MPTAIFLHTPCEAGGLIALGADPDPTDSIHYLKLTRNPSAVITVTTEALCHARCLDRPSRGVERRLLAI